MQLGWNEEQLTLRHRFAEFGHMISERSARYYDQFDFDYNVWRMLAEEGIWKIPVPEAYGGDGKSWWEYAASMEGLSTTANDLGFLLSMIAHVGCMYVIMENGTPEQKEKYLPLLISGGIGATAATEPVGGSDVSRIKTSATASEESYILNGHKTHITNAPIADVFVIVGRIPSLGKYDITLFLLDKHVQGLSLGATEQMLGNRTSPTGDILFDHTEITSEHILGTPGEGLGTLYNFLTLDRLLYGLVAASFTETILENSLHYANKRVAFKTRIAENQYIQQKITDMKLNMETTRWVTYAALDQLLKGTPDASLMGSISKLIGTEHLCQTAKHYYQLHGHRGYMLGNISKVLCDAIGTLIAGGTSEMQRKNIFNQLEKLYQITPEPAYNSSAKQSKHS